MKWKEISVVDFWLAAEPLGIMHELFGYLILCIQVETDWNSECIIDDVLKYFVLLVLLGDWEICRIYRSNGNGLII